MPAEVSMTGQLRASAAAAAARVNLETLRYYERRGLLAEPHRSLGGHRLYTEDDVALLRIIKSAQALGFTLSEVADLIDAGGHRHRRPDLTERAKNKLLEVQRKIRSLTLIAGALEAAIEANCHDIAECDYSEDCPIPFTELLQPPPDREVPSE